MKHSLLSPIGNLNRIGGPTMKIDQPGWVTDRILLLGRKESCVYVLKGNGEYILLGGGMVHIVPDLLNQLDEFGIGEDGIKRIIILHSHFDHCGIVPFFKKRWPWAMVTASEKAKSLLSAPKVIASIAHLNQKLIETYGRGQAAEELGLSFEGIEVEETVKEDDVIVCGDRSIKILEVPGHSTCSLAAYVPEEKALFASDAGGIPKGDKVFTAANSNFDLYQQNLKRMAELDIEFYFAEHQGAMTGIDAREYLHKSMNSAAETRRLIESSFRNTRDEKKCTEEMTELLLEKYSVDFLPRDVFQIVVGQMVHYIAKQYADASRRT